jgi:hypothetical protein
MHDQPVIPLRQRMLDGMAVRNFSDNTRHDYVRHVKSFASFWPSRSIPQAPTICAKRSCIPQSMM